MYIPIFRHFNGHLRVKNAFGSLADPFLINVYLRDLLKDKSSL